MKRAPLFFLLVLTACVAPVRERPNIENVDARITGLDFRGVDLMLDLHVRNPWAFSVKTPKFRYALDIEESRFDSGEKTSGIDLPARGVGNVQLPFRLNYLDIGKLYRNLSDAKEVDYGISGAFLIPAFGTTFELPVSHRGTFPVLRMFNIRALKFLTPEFPLGGATIGIEAAVTNPNLFELGLDNVGYRLRIGDIDLGEIAAATDTTIAANAEGRLTLSGRVSAVDTILQLITGRNIGATRLDPVGEIRTPWGNVAIEKP